MILPKVTVLENSRARAEPQVWLMSTIRILNHYAAHLLNKRQYGIVGKSLDFQSRTTPVQIPPQLLTIRGPPENA